MASPQAGPGSIPPSGGTEPPSGVSALRVTIPDAASLRCALCRRRRAYPRCQSARPRQPRLPAARLPRPSGWLRQGFDRGCASGLAVGVGTKGVPSHRRQVACRPGTEQRARRDRESVEPPHSAKRSSRPVRLICTAYCHRRPCET